MLLLPCLRRLLPLGMVAWLLATVPLHAQPPEPSKMICLTSQALISLAWSGDRLAPSHCKSPFNAEQAKKHQRDWAKHLTTPVELAHPSGISFVLIPPGEFLMGSTPAQAHEAEKLLRDLLERVHASERDRLANEEQPRHRVVISRPFRIGRTEVTIGQYRKFVQSANYVTETERFGGGNSGKIDESDPKKKNINWKAPGYKVTEESPVTQITVADMFEFCNWLSKQDGKKPCYHLDQNTRWQRTANANGYRLPTEAEWEYACRAGTTGQYSFGNDVAMLGDYAWFNKNANAFGAGPVASKKPNPWGLYDMHGNAWERCQDYHEAKWYARSDEIDPQGPVSGSRTIVRGGGWHYFHLHCRSAYRNNYSPISRTANTGFRIVCPMENSQTR